MSAAEIIANLSALTIEERRAVARRLRDLEEQDEMQFLHESAVDMFREMDRAEAQDARRKAS